MKQYKKTRRDDSGTRTALLVIDSVVYLTDITVMNGYGVTIQSIRHRPLLHLNIDRQS